MSRKVSDKEMSELVHVLGGVSDPRVKGRCKHLLIDVLILTVCAVLCRAETITEIEEFGKNKFEWLSKFLTLPNGIPSHDTIARILCLIDCKELEAIFAKWVQSVIVSIPSTISLDGKSSKGTDRRFNGDSRPLHLVSAYSHEHGLSLCQSESLSSGNAEMTAAIECLQQLDLLGVTVLADAGLNSPKILKVIREKKGHYIVPIKSNHRRCSLCVRQGETDMMS